MEYRSNLHPEGGDDVHLPEFEALLFHACHCGSGAPRGSADRGASHVGASRLAARGSADHLRLRCGRARADGPIDAPRRKGRLHQQTRRCREPYILPSTQGQADRREFLTSLPAPLTRWGSGRLSPPRPANRTCGFLAYGSPVGSFRIGSVSLHVTPYETSGLTCAKRTWVWTAQASLDVVTDADTMGSVQSPASACDQLVASGFCARLALRHSSALFVPCSALCTSAFLPTFPPRGFARRASRGSSPQQDYAGSDSCRPLARSTGLSAYSAPPAKHPDPNHVMSPECRFASHFSASSPTLSGLRLRQRSQARQLTPPKRVRHPTGCSFASSCFPPRLAATQLLSTSCAVTPHGRDSHPADEASSRTHDRRPRAGPFFPPGAASGQPAIPPVLSPCRCNGSEMRAGRRPVVRQRAGWKPAV